MNLELRSFLNQRLDLFPVSISCICREPLNNEKVVYFIVAGI